MDGHIVVCSRFHPTCRFVVTKRDSVANRGHTVLYLTGAPIYKDGVRVQGKESTAKGEAKGLEHLHLVAYDIETEKFKDHGPIFFDGNPSAFPTYINSLAAGPGGRQIFALGRVELEGITDLFVVTVPEG